MLERTDIKANASNKNISVGKESSHFYNIFVFTVSKHASSTLSLSFSWTHQKTLKNTDMIIYSYLKNLSCLPRIVRKKLFSPFSSDRCFLHLWLISSHWTSGVMTGSCRPQGFYLPCSSLTLPPYVPQIIFVHSLAFKC